MYNTKAVKWQVLWVMVIMLFFVVLACQKPVYDVALRNETYLASAGVMFRNDAGEEFYTTAAPGSTNRMTAIEGGSYYYEVIAIDYYYGNIVFSTSGNKDLTKNLTCVFYWDGYNYNYRWE